eukprot:scaffold36275_cov154-Isochrysis_galbana.AAC.19
MATPGSNIRLTPVTRPLTHSFNCKARSPAWLATSAAEHAVSYETHGPCMPSAKEMRPDATE